MRILFWNTNRNENINEYVANLVRDYKIDMLIMAEYVADKDNLQELLEEYGQALSEENTLGCDRINIWSSYKDIKPGVQETYYSIQMIQNKYTVCCVHSITDLHGDCSEERLAIAQRIMYDVKKAEDTIKSQKTILIGDFNEMPYDKGCLNANGFHGLPVLNEDDKLTRTVNSVEYPQFYNPMWNLFGDFTYPPGTYYLKQSKLYSPMWFMLDQVIVSKAILPFFKKDSLKIITTCSYSDLMDKNKHPNKMISDHFPIMCEILDE